MLPSSNKKHIKVSHILYAYDALLFVRVNARNAKAVSFILKFFEEMSGLCVNPSKSKIFLGRRSNASVISSILKMESSDLPSSYLGLPLFSGRLSKSMCQPLINKIQRRLDSWKSKILSFVGRVELLISTLTN